MRVGLGHAKPGGQKEKNNLLAVPNYNFRFPLRGSFYTRLGPSLVLNPVRSFRNIKRAGRDASEWSLRCVPTLRFVYLSLNCIFVIFLLNYKQGKKETMK